MSKHVFRTGEYQVTIEDWRGGGRAEVSRYTVGGGNTYTFTVPPNERQAAAQVLAGDKYQVVSVDAADYYDRLREWAQGLAKHGLGADLNPTIDMSSTGAVYQHFQRVLEKLDEDIRRVARWALGQDEEDDVADAALDSADLLAPEPEAERPLKRHDPDDPIYHRLTEDHRPEDEVQCLRCGAIVSGGSTELHSAWHYRIRTGLAS